MRMFDRLLGRRGQDTNNRVPIAYCFKCKSRQRIKNPAQMWMKNGRSRIQGSCDTCGRNISKLGKLVVTADS
ncbi:MAG: DUF5679 domain-containing protein [Dehalococcoidia bacterium]